MYRAMEHGQPLRVNEKVSSLLKDVGQRLMMFTSEVDAVPIKKPCTSTDSARARVNGEQKNLSPEKKKVAPLIGQNSIPPDDTRMSSACWGQTKMSPGELHVWETENLLQAVCNMEDVRSTRCRGDASVSSKIYSFAPFP